jgi:hypothetical protein
MMITSRTMGLAGHVADMGEMRNTHRILVVKPESCETQTWIR